MELRGNPLGVNSFFPKSGEKEEGEEEEEGEKEGEKEGDEEEEEGGSGSEDGSGDKEKPKDTIGRFTDMKKDKKKRYEDLWVCNRKK